MLNDKYVSQIEGLEDVQYVGPKIVKPSKDVDSPGHDDFIGPTNGGGQRNPTVGNHNNQWTRLEVVVIATLISTIIGLLGSFILFKKIYSHQNCLAPCDGTGIDKDYIEDCHHLGMAPVPSTTTDDELELTTGGRRSSSSTRRSSGMNSVNSVSVATPRSHGALSSIDENSIATSDMESLYSANISLSTGKSVALRSVGSLHSEQTMIVSNTHGRRDYHRTPSFGERDDKEVSFLSAMEQYMFPLMDELNYLILTNFVLCSMFI